MALEERMNSRIGYRSTGGTDWSGLPMPQKYRVLRYAEQVCDEGEECSQTKRCMSGPRKYSVVRT